MAAVLLRERLVAGPALQRKSGHARCDSALQMRRRFAIMPADLGYAAPAAAQRAAARRTASCWRPGGRPRSTAAGAWRCPAIRRDLVGIAAGLEHAMAGHDDHEGIAGDRLRHRMRGAGGAAARWRPRHRCGSPRAGWSRANFVNPLVEGGDAGHVERDLGKIGVAAAQQRGDALDRDLDIQRRAQVRGHRDRAGTAAAGFRSPAPPAIARRRCRAWPHAMPQRPIAVSKIVYPRPAITRLTQCTLPRRRS